MQRKQKMNLAQANRVILETTPVLKRILGSRLEQPPYQMKPSEMGIGGGGKFLGLPLPLLPDISKSEVTIGEDNSVLKVYGISQREDTEVVLFKGPNRKANRYLKHQYTKMLESIGGTIDPGQATGSVQGSTKLNLSYTPEGGHVDKFGRKIPPSIIWSLKLRELVGMPLKRADKQALKRRIKTFWHIAMNLLVNSKSFRLALLNKTLAKHGWFHRAYTISDLVEFNKGFLEIAKNFKQNQPVRRT